MEAKDKITKLYTEDLIRDALEEARKAGIREVVEWIKNQRACDVEEIINEVGHRDRTLKPLNYFIIHESDIPLQLKEWGIESKGGERK